MEFQFRQCVGLFILGAILDCGARTLLPQENKHREALLAAYRHSESSLHDLVPLYQAQRHYAKADPLFERSLKIYEAKLGKDHPYVATSLNSLALLFQAQGLYAKAEALYLRSLNIREAVMGKD